MIEKKASSFWIGCVTFARIYPPVMRMTSSCTVFEVLVAFLLPVSKCSWRFLSELPNSIRMAWKFPLLDAVPVLSSRWPLRGMFCLPHNIMVLMIALSAFMFFSNISWFCVEILYGKVSFGFWTLRIMAMPASSAHWWHCIFWWRSSTLSFPVAFSSYWNGAVTRGLFCARGSDGLHHTIFAKTSHLWRTIYKPRILFLPRGLEHMLLGMFVFSLNHSLGEKACVWRRRSEMVLKVFHFFMGLKSSWINFATYDVPDIKVGYNMLISGRKLGNTYKPRKSFIDKSSNWFLTDCDMKTEHWQAKCLLINVS